MIKSKMLLWIFERRIAGSVGSSVCRRVVDHRSGRAAPAVVNGSVRLLGRSGAAPLVCTASDAAHLFGRSYSSRASGYDANGEELIRNGLEYEEKSLHSSEALDFNTEWEIFKELLNQIHAANQTSGCEITTSADVAREVLMTTVDVDEYGVENDFNKALFEAFKSLMDGAIGEADSQNRQRFCLAGVEIGFGGFIDRQQHSELLKDFQLDHACCIFDNNMNVRHALASVELKMHDTMCDLYIDTIRNKVLEPNLRNAESGGPVGQAVAYAIRGVLVDLAKAGIQPKVMPWLILACKRRGVASVGNYQFILGSVIIPLKCGDRLRYSMEDVGLFGGVNSAKRAMAAYLRVMNFGLTNAKLLQDQLQTPAPAMVTGQELYIAATRVDDLRLLASPYQAHNDKRGITISQGELLTGKLDWDMVREYVSTRNNPSCLIFDSDVENSCRVIFKVSSKIFHHMLIDPVWTFSAMEAISRYLSKENAAHLFYVLLAVQHSDQNSLVTVMRNLSEEGYIALEPKQYDREQMLGIWDQFSKLVHNALIPLAEQCGVVFADLRIGWERTYNVMVHRETKEIRLIDFESLTRNLGFKEQQNAFHVHHDSNFAAYRDGKLKFVWWQCILVAHCWSSKTVSTQFNSRDVVVLLKEGFVENNWKGIHKLSRDECNALHANAVDLPENCSSKDIMKTLMILRRMFE